MAVTLLRSPEAAARWLRSWCTGALRTDSRAVQPGDAFIAWPGYAVDGRRYVPAALDAGATTCLVEAEGLDGFGFADARIAALPALKAATGSIADDWFGRPSDAIEIVAVTGTNGKTSSSWWIAQALTSLGRRCGVVGTLGIGVPPDGIEFTGLTTPDPVRLQQAFRRFADDGFAACAIEASSIGIVEQRLAGTRVRVAVLTNFTQDHLDYHGSMAAYWAAKRQLFGWPGLQAAVINIDDAQGATLAEELRADAIDLWTVSAQSPARLQAQAIRHLDGGLAFDVVEGSERIELRSRLIGDYNVHNLLGVIGTGRALGLALQDIGAALPALAPVPGRMQRVASRRPGPAVVVDYAHTPDALLKVLRALKPLAAARGGSLWCVFGCGGNRDAGKRPQMGAVAAAESQRIVVTSDNPRGEAPQAIIDQILAGIPRSADVQAIVDRRAAIAAAIGAAAPADVVLLAGKGHEDTQEIAGVKHPFSDLAEAAAALEARA